MIINLLYGCQQVKEDNPPSSQVENIKQKDKDETMNIIINELTYHVKLYNNTTVAEFIKLLPITLQMKDLHGNEKYKYLDQRLPVHTESVQQIKTGDLMLFQDNCLVLFYKDFQTSYSYTKIGYIENVASLSDQLGKDSIAVRFQKEENK